MTYGLRGNNAIGIGIVNSIANVSGWIGPSIQAAAYLFLLFYIYLFIFILLFIFVYLFQK